MKLSLVLAAFACVACLAAASSINSGLVNSKITRVLDIRTHMEEVQFSVDVENKGKEAANEYIVAIPASKASRLSFFLFGSIVEKAGAADEEDENNKYIFTRLDSARTTVNAANAPAGSVFIAVKLAQPLRPNQSIKLQGNIIFTRTLVPLPAEIAQSDAQLVLFEDSLYLYSPYQTVQQSTQVRLASSKVEEYTKRNANQQGDTIEYGPFNNIEAFAQAPLRVHSENNFPFVTARSLRKFVEVSHWGNINVEEWYILEHSGATLKGGFSRYDYQRNQKMGNSFRAITGYLPNHAYDLYYRDQIGNISTSNVREGDNGLISWEVQPRFPMFGGWQTDFYIGYNLPAADYISTSYDDSSIHVLNITFGSSFPQIGVDDAEIHIVLPEFVSDVKFVTPFEVDSVDHVTKLTYLDTTGRHVVVIRKANIVRNHNEKFQVVYRFSRTSMLQEPLLLIIAFMFFFLASIVYVRIDLSLTSGKGSRPLFSTRGGEAGDAINRLVKDVLNILSKFAILDVEAGKVLLRDANAQIQALKKDRLLVDIVDRLEKRLQEVQSTSSRLSKAAAGQSDADLKSRIQDVNDILAELADA